MSSKIAVKILTRTAMAMSVAVGLTASYMFGRGEGFNTGVQAGLIVADAAGDDCPSQSGATSVDNLNTYAFQNIDDPIYQALGISPDCSLKDRSAILENLRLQVEAHRPSL